MDNGLYIARASRFIETDPARGLFESRTERSSYHVVTASDGNLAAEKLLTHLKQNTRYSDWGFTEVKELTAGADIPLEKKFEILGEVFPVIK